MLKTENNYGGDSGNCFASEVGITVTTILKLSFGFSGAECSNISIIIKNPEVSLSDQG